MFEFLCGVVLSVITHFGVQSYDTYSRFSELKQTLESSQATMDESEKAYQKQFFSLVEELEKYNNQVSTLMDEQVKKFGLSDRKELLGFVFSLRRCAEQGQQESSLYCIIDGWRNLDITIRELIAQTLEETYGAIAEQDRVEDLLMAMAINSEEGTHALPDEFNAVLTNLDEASLNQYLELIKYVLINTALTKQFLAARGLDK